MRHKSVVEAHIVDFVERFVSGSSLLEPRFKHDLLDLKHFTAGMFSTTRYQFTDGNVTFCELIFRAFYEIDRNEKVSINAQLLIDTVYLFLKTLSPPVKEALPYFSPTPEQKKLIATARTNVAFYVHALVQPHWQKNWILELVKLFSEMQEDEMSELYMLTMRYFSERENLPLIFIIQSIHAVELAKRRKILEAINHVHTASYQIDALCQLIQALNSCSENEYSYIAKSLNILQFHLQKVAIYLTDVRLFLRAIRQKLENQVPDEETAHYYCLIPNM